jgi:hypothetical protein
MGQHCPTHPLKVNKVHAADILLHSSSVLQEFHLSKYVGWQKLTNDLEEATSSVSTIKMEETTISNFMVEKRSDDKFLSVYVVSQPGRQLSLQICSYSSRRTGNWREQYHIRPIPKKPENQPDTS